MVAILFATSNKDEAFNCGSREDQVTVATFIIIERSCAITILIEAAAELLGWRRQEREDILIIRGSRASHLTIMTITIQGYCANVIISVTTGRHDKVFKNTGKLLG